MGYKKRWYDDEAWLRLSFIDKGMKVAEMAQYAGVSTETMRKLLIKYNLTKGK